jgi:hypothetical protein
LHEKCNRLNFLIMERKKQLIPLDDYINKYKGKKYNRLTILDFSHKDKYKRYFNVLCDCGSKKTMNIHWIISGNSKSCGCLMREIAAELCRNKATHGKSGTRIYNIWIGIINRCNNSTWKEYAKYGARGIMVCNDWLDYKTFEYWVNSSGYSDDLSIDRIDNNGNYEPSNCKWSTPTEQANNRRSSVYLEYNGEIKTIANWSRVFNVSQGVIGQRVKMGWSIEDAISKPIRKIVYSDGTTDNTKILDLL